MSAKSALPLTREQKLAVETIGGSLLVSAAAGSGKTAVLAERCAYLVCDAPQPCDVDELLVVTFTEAAAAEMKSRIGRSIRGRIGKKPSARLQRQLNLIDRMQVSTLHSFCARLIRQHFHLLNLDPSFTVMDGDEAALLRIEIARQLFADRYEGDIDGKFQAFVDAYGDGNDERLIHQTIATHELLCSLVDPPEWIRRALSRIEQACTERFEESELGKELLNVVWARLEDVLQRCREAYKVLAQQKHFAKYLEPLKEMGLMLRHWQDVFKSDGLDALCEVGDVELPKLPSMSNSIPGKDAAKALMDGIREELKDGTLRSVLRFNCGQWTTGMKSMCDSAKVFLSLVEEFGARYAAEKSATRAVDFSDLERLALAALADKKGDGSLFSPLRPSPVARMLHEQFKHLLVDEYQDINEVQNAILSLASTECLTVKDEGGRMKDEKVSVSSFILPPSSFAPNLFTVGDVKQSIYRFRLAEPHLFLSREQRFRQADQSVGTVIDLQSNFRGRKPLLDALNEVFRRLMTKAAVDIEYDKTQQLNAGLTYPPSDGVACFPGSPMELHLLPRDVPAADDHEPAASADEEDLDRSEREALLIARRILSITGRDGSAPKQVIEKQPDDSLAPRSAKFSDIVLLLRSMRYKSEQFAEILRAAVIPVHSDSATGYFESMEVRDILALLKVLDNRRQDIPLASVLRSPIASLPNPEDALARVRLAYPVLSFHDAVVCYARDKDDELAAALRNLLHQLDRWREMAQRRPLAELLWEIYDSIGYLAFCAGLADGEQRVANLIDLHERARQFGSFHRQGLARFLAFLDSLQTESDLGQPSVVSGAEDVVRIMSIHRSKGLEFPIVILPDLGKAINLTDCTGSILVDRHAYLGLSAIDEMKQIRYPSLASTLVETRIRQQSLAEELRVLYVAMTRAKEHLILTGTCSDSKCESWTSRFGGHTGAFSADAILSAKTMLDWLGPVSAASPGIFEIHRYTPQEVASWPAAQGMRPTISDDQQRLARLEPLEPAPGPHAGADAILERLTARYKFQEFTEVPATQSVTGIAKHPRASEARGAMSRDPFADELRPQLPSARSLDGEIQPSAADIGSATHLLLEHLDFTRPCDRDDLRAQLDDLLDRRLISPAAAKAVDLDAVCWFASTELAQFIRRNGAAVHRELPVYFSLSPAECHLPAGGSSPPASMRSDDPQDRIMIRSRLDVLIGAADGVEVIDYKTDRVTADSLTGRVEMYRPQMDFYRRAVESILARPPRAVHLVFLAARQIHSF